MGYTVSRLTWIPSAAITIHHTILHLLFASLAFSRAVWYGLRCVQHVRKVTSCPDHAGGFRTREASGLQGSALV